MQKSASSKLYRCAFPSCSKTYSKPSRLEEHTRSHTNSRPFVCSFDGCQKSYLRESHLQAHSRTHLGYDNRPLLCEDGACGKRFWTGQHLRNHMKQVHSGEKPYAVCFVLLGMHFSRIDRRCSVRHVQKLSQNIINYAHTLQVHTILQGHRHIHVPQTRPVLHHSLQINNFDLISKRTRKIDIYALIPIV